jgi:hypothetical protein
MESRTTKTFSDSVIVWPDDLRYFDNFLRKSFTKVEYGGTCEDNTDLKADGLADLLEYENPDFKRLASITIKASDEQPLGNSIEIVIGKSGIFSSDTANAHFRFKDVKQQGPIEDEVIKRIKTMRPWYFWLTRIPFKFLLPVLPYGCSFTLNTVSLIKKLIGLLPMTPPAPSPLTENEGFVLVLGVTGILFLVGYLIDRSRDFLFPNCFFCIGRQRASFERRRAIAYIVFGVIILGILINIVSAFISQPFVK